MGVVASSLCGENKKPKKKDVYKSNFFIEKKGDSDVSQNLEAKKIVKNRLVTSGKHLNENSNTLSRSDCKEQEQTSKKSQKASSGTWSFFKNEKKKLGLSSFDIMAPLGKGAFGSVVLVRKKSNSTYYAMKILKKKNFTEEERSIEKALIEKYLLLNNNHPFLASLKYSFQEETSIYYVMDYIEGGMLFSQLRIKRRFSLQETTFYAAEVLLAIKHLHEELNTTYKDLKPENILLDRDGHIKLTDFGLSKGKFYCSKISRKSCIVLFYRHI